MALEVGLIFTDYETCANLYAIDDTGDYNALSNTTGYGGPNPATTDVTDFSLVLTYNSLGNQEAEFVFEVTTGTITAATLAFAGEASTDILADLQSTSFPFTSLNPFNFGRDYGTTLPTLEDGVYTLEYTIEGNFAGDPFTYSATKTICLDCNTELCIKNIFLYGAVESDEVDRAYKADKRLIRANYAAEAGNFASATTILNQAAQICDETNSGCGCG